MTIHDREHADKLASAIRAVEERAIRHAVIFGGYRDLLTLGRYVSMTLRDHGGKENAYSVAAIAKVLHLLNDALEVAELRRILAFGAG